MVIEEVHRTLSLGTNIQLVNGAVERIILDRLF
jgi:hypothetical protein